MVVNRGRGLVDASSAGHCALCKRPSLTLVTDGKLMVCREHISGAGYDSRPKAGICVCDGGHPAAELWRTRWGPLCLTHLRVTVKVALWPEPFNPYQG